MTATFPDLEDLEDAIRGADVELFQRGPGTFECGLTRADLDRTVIHFGWQRVSTITYGSNGSGFLVALDCAGECYSNGHPLHEGSMLLYLPDGEHFGHTTAGVDWVFLSVPPQELERMNAVTFSDDPLSRYIHFRPEPEIFQALRSTLCRVRSTLQADPAVLGSSEARKGMERSLLESFTKAMDSSTFVGNGLERGYRSHSRVVSRAQAYMRSHLREPIYMADLCKAAGISERSLRTSFQDLCGISPNRHLKVRRMNQIRRAFRKADPHVTTVAAVAVEFGFWDMSRFAVEYKQMFGESPSQTLRSASERRST